MSKQHEVSRVFFRLKLVDRQVVDSNQLDVTLNQKFCGRRFEIYELLIKRPINPMTGIVGFEKNPFHAIKLKRFHLPFADGWHTFDFKNVSFSDKGSEWDFVEATASCNEMKRRVDMGTGVRSHFDIGQTHGMALVP